MKIFYGQKRTELIVYAVVWILIFAVPILWEYLQAGSSLNEFDRFGIYRNYLTISAFCLLFLLHNFLVAPRLVYKGKRWSYLFGSLCLVALFFVYMSYRRGVRRHFFFPPPMERMEKSDRMKKADEKSQAENSGKDTAQACFAPKKEKKPWEYRGREFRRHPWMRFGGQEMMLFWLFLLLMGSNVGIKYYFRTLGIKRRMLELEHENLSQQLTYLKYQINPHFFMNTLNNIHALVSIDPVKAEETIEVLSKLMRYVLYDGDKPLASLQKETDFLKNYIELMRIRYDSRVRIDVSVPDVVPQQLVPPLIFVTFVENAFKHGVSYERESFIEVRFVINEGGVMFTCRNSCHAAETMEKGGVGLNNVRRRLTLIYHNDYRLKIENKDNIFNVCLTLPFLSNAEVQALQPSHVKPLNNEAKP